MRHAFQSDIDTISAIAAVPRILDVVCDATGMGFAAVARVTEANWVTCAVRDDIRFGLRPGDALKVETTICHEIRQHGAPVTIDDVAGHPVYGTHHTPALYGFRSYISVPITLADGRFFGTLCAIDPAPRRLDTPATLGMFKLFAEMIGFQIDAQERVLTSQAALAEEQEAAVLREQFIAVMGHDLRNPLASVDACLRMLARTELAEKPAGLVQMAQRSVRRMAGLISDVMDLAAGRLRHGIPVSPGSGIALEEGLRQVVAEVAASAPDRRIEATFALAAPVACDVGRLMQLGSNLLTNAVAHGAAEAPIRLRATSGPDGFELEVGNAGAPIPPEALGRLFQPYFRASGQPGQQGLGLGLYIAAEIARAHGGALRVASDAAETRFTFTMPVASAECLATKVPDAVAV
ncbi:MULTISPECIES: GAF domain-containing sensor histidine kinase [Roseomonadaceae]|uniref:histidine kinase n=1 Tax=Falsiroseomonas oleicola TaxID=2801474 RepID=A0ABS6H3P5_9PROT|nr:GAF domain-containing sensor histidine kinase [Roseomonas oleicola]MBU8543287.1 GAF domain-containing sensor histidine kinase [Roseomonas oleicola]